MSYWMTDPAANRRSNLNTADPLVAPEVDPGPGFFEGALGAVPTGAKHMWDVGAVAVGENLMDPLAGAIEPLDEILGTNAADYIRDQTERARDIERRNRVDPNTMGEVARVLHGASGVVTAAVVGAATGGTAGAALFAGAGAGYDEYNQLVEAGVDPETAKKVAGITAVDTAVGVALPMTLGGGVLGAVAWGAGSNVALGAVGRYDSGRVLEEAGYADMAQQYKALDGVAIATDVLMGAAFPLVGKGVEAARARLRPEDVPERITPEQADAADVGARIVHEQRDLAPGLHKTPESANAHAEALARMDTEVLVRGRDPQSVDLTDAVARLDTLPDPAQVRAADEVRAGIVAEAPKAAAVEFERVAKEAARQEVAAARADLEKAAVAEKLPEFPKPPPEPAATPMDGKAPTSGKAPAAEAPKDATTLAEAEQPGRAIPDKLADSIVARIKAGEREVDGKPSAFLEAGAAIRRAGGLRTADEGRAFVARMAKLRDEGLTGEAYQARVREVVDEFTPKAETPVDYDDTAAVARAGDIGALEQAAVNQALEAVPDLKVPDPDNPGATVSARDLMARLDNEIEEAKQDATLSQVAAACFMTFKG